MLLTNNDNNTMRLSDLKHILTTLDSVDFRLENGTVIPQHFHVTDRSIFM